MSSSSTRLALQDALDDEYKARATYQAVLEKFGSVLPFARIVESEGRHIKALQQLFMKRDWPIPPDPWAGQIPAPSSLAEACHHGVQAEVDNVALYDQLFTMTSDSDVIAVFTALRRASQERHLPAFQRCSDRSSAAPRTKGQGRRRQAHRSC